MVAGVTRVAQQNVVTAGLVLDRAAGGAGGRLHRRDRRDHGGGRCGGGHSPLKLAVTWVTGGPGATRVARAAISAAISDVSSYLGRDLRCDLGDLGLARAAIGGGGGGG